jgi:two-component system phosphate regulon response regulator OmpR
MDKEMSSLDTTPQVLIIEHDPALRKAMQISLEQVGVSVEAVSKYTNALQILQQTLPEVFILDIDLRDGDPGRLISAYREHRNRDNGTVMVSTANRLEDKWRREYRPDTVIYKPFDMRYLIRKICLLTKNKSVPV